MPRDGMQPMATRYSLVVPVYRNEETIPDLLAALSGIDRELGGAPRGGLRHRRQPGPFARLAGRCAAANGPYRAGARDVAQLRRVRGDSRRPDRGDGPALRGHGGGPAGAAGTRGRVLPPAGAGCLRRRLRCARGARRSVAVAARLGAVLGGLSPAGAARDAAGRRRRVRLQRPGARRAGRLDRGAFEPDRSAALDRHAARRGPLSPSRATTRTSAWTLRKKLAYLFDSSLAFSDLPIRLLFGVGMLALAVAVVYGTIVLAARLTGLIAEPGYAADGAPDLRLRRAERARAGRGRRVCVARVREHQGPSVWRSCSGGPRSARASGGCRKRGGTPMTVFKHPQAICETKNVGPRTRIWAFAHVLPGARIGADCNICDHTFIENDVTVGDRVTVKCGVQLWDGARIEDDVFIGPNATFSNDRFPRSKRRPKRVSADHRDGGGVDRGQRDHTAGHHHRPRRDGGRRRGGHRLGAAVRGRRRQSGADRELLRRRSGRGGAGDPHRGRARREEQGARRLRRATRRGRGPARQAGGGRDRRVPAVQGEALLHGPRRAGTRGARPARAPQVPPVPRVRARQLPGDRRRRAATGRSSCSTDPAIGVYLPPRTWGVQYDYSPDAALLVFASHAYDARDYVRDYEAFLQLVRR